MRARAQASARRLARVPRQLRKVFGLAQLRPGQHEAIARTLRGLNSLVVMPTGAGKSLCYQLPATLLDGLTVVVSPLIALMQDQCDRLMVRGVAAVQFNSALDAQAERDAADAVRSGRATIAFCTPERLGDPDFVTLLRSQPIALLVVDEAHCISQWGHDFRPAFTEIGNALAPLGAPPVLALTATASDEVIADIAAQLQIPAAGVLVGSSYRANLHYSVALVSGEADKLRQAVQHIAQRSGPAIVYTATVKAAEAVVSALANAGQPAYLYHGKLRTAARAAAQQGFMDDPNGVMVATNAFGLGIDKADIRLVLHYQLPAGLDVYYQESGRAGRDGAAADCVLLFMASDRAVQQFFLNGRYPSLEDGQALLRALQKPAADAPWTLARLKDALQRPMAKLRVLVNLLRREHWLAVDDDGSITPHPQQPPSSGLSALLARYVERGEQDQQRLEQMVFYAQTGACRWRVVLECFEEPLLLQRCQTCDNCRRMAALEQPAAASAPDTATIAATQTQQVLATARKPFVVGDKVKVKRYGAGTVVEATAEWVTVQLTGEQTRCFHPDFVRHQRATAPVVAAVA